MIFNLFDLFSIVTYVEKFIRRISYMFDTLIFALIFYGILSEKKKNRIWQTIHIQVMGESGGKEEEVNEVEH